tara:strand:- start:756 stop:1010 length:255 start_codon:yes stop_codon:yes gene_type:complete
MVNMLSKYSIVVVLASAEARIKGIILAYYCYVNRTGSCVKKLMCMLTLSLVIGSCGQAGSLYIPDAEQTDLKNEVQNDVQGSDQ